LGRLPIDIHESFFDNGPPFDPICPMHAQDFRLPVQYIRQIADQVTRMGAELPAWFDQRVLTEPGPDGQEQTVSFDDLQRLILDAFERTQEPALGLLLGERLLANSHGMLGYAAMSSATIRQAVELLGSYFQLRTTLVSARHDIVDGEVRFVCVDTIPLGDIRRPVLEAVVLTVKNVVDYIASGAFKVSSASFAFPEPGYADLARDIFGCEVRYGQSWTGFSMPASVLDEPLATADPNAFAQATLICQRELDKLMQQQSWGARVRRVILEKRGGFPSLNVMARLFNLTSHTLHRRLTEEGTSYRDILDDVRHMLAIEHLKTDHLSIQEIAFNLGYTEMANFRRAFKRWESVSPSEYRAAHQSLTATPR